MDAKITLRFDREVIRKAKRLAEANNISLSRLTELLFKKITSANYQKLEELPVADWVQQLAEGEVEYKTSKRTRKAVKSEFYKSR
jgi:antitoxin component of RelBE/YafQ-DinJ toxin-antitoxin module